MSGIVSVEERSGEFGWESEIKRRLSTVEPQEMRLLSVERGGVKNRKKVRMKRDNVWVLIE